MPVSVSVTDVVRNFADYISRVAYRQESFVLMRGSRPVAELKPVPVGRRLGDLPLIMSSLPHLDADDADQFERDLDDARTELQSQGVRDPWEY